ncbi:MAG: type II/IV secretion system protein [Planctomycetes bacterium]|nr:type II/IV secretion system protein [Planctomycetota bacterium]
MTVVSESIISLLIEKGYALEEDISEVQKRSESSGDSFEAVLLKSGTVTGKQFAECLAEEYGLESIGNDTILVGSPAATELVSLEYARSKCVLPLKVINSQLVVAVADPSDLSIVDDLSFMSKGLHIVCKVGPRDAIQKGIGDSYGGSEADVDNLLRANEDVEVKSDDVEDVQDDDAPVIALVNAIIANAVKMQASDIHIESMENSIRVRYRIDGKCIVLERPPKRLQGALFGRIKLMARMDVAEKRKPQDGPIKLKVEGRNIDLRVSTLPSSFGESIVMRILDKESVMKGVDQLGFHASDYGEFQELIKRPNGIVLVTGPTGSGKTTTLYAALNEKNKSNVKIITAEDPVEYNVSGINQIQVNHQIGLDFARILRAMLRQAPNVILVGEIRDLETAEVAIEASLTGHLVFSTLHTNDAPSSVTRLIDMGIKPYLVSASVIAILAQRLIRLNCTKCKEEYVPTQNKLIAAGITDEMMEGKKFYRGKGCVACNRTGYKGRIGIYELLRLSSELRTAIFNNEPSHILREIAIKSGMHTLLMDGVRKVFAGITSVEEVLRVAKSSE